MWSKSPRTVPGVLLFALMVLPGARCREEHVEVVATGTASGPSSGITPVPGSGATWSYGSDPPTGPKGALWGMINSERTSHGLKPLAWHDGLAAVSKVHDDDMNSVGYLALVSPKGVSVFQRLVSSSPPISFSNAYAFVTSGGGGPNAGFTALMNTAAGFAAIHDPTMTHFGARGIGGAATFIFGANVTP